MKIKLLYNFFLRIFFVNLLLMISFVLPSHASLSETKNIKGDHNKIDEKTVFEEVLLEFSLNHKKLKDYLIMLRNNEGKFFINKEDVLKNRIKLPSDKPIIYNKKEFYDLNLLSDKYKFDENNVSIDIIVPHELFKESKLICYNEKPLKITPLLNSAFVNYDLLFSHNKSADVTTSLVGMTELVYSCSNGVFSNIFNLEHNREKKKLTRLESYWIYDDTKLLKRWTVGDLTSSTGDYWGGSAKIGGIKISSNFDIRPDLITGPLPSFDGEAILPSKIEVLIDGVKRWDKHIESGKFSLYDIPIQRGKGDMSVLITDILGREKVINLPYYSGPKLLKPGLTSFSYETGLIRKNYNKSNLEYGSLLFSGTYYTGITNDWTVGYHGELLRDVKALGLTNIKLLDQYGYLYNSFAVSHSNLGAGCLASLGYNNTIDNLSFGGNALASTYDFARIGISEKKRSPKTEFSSFVGFSHAKLGAISLRFAERNSRTSGRDRALSISYYKDLPYDFNFSLRCSSSLKGEYTTLFSLSWGFDNYEFRSTFSGDKTKLSRKTIDFSKSNDSDIGYNYKLFVSLDDEGENTYAGSLTLERRIGDYELKVSDVGKAGKTYSLNAKGSIVRIDGKTFFSKLMDDSFALVNLPQGFTGVDVLRENRLAGITDSSGDVLISNLSPYVNNEIEIDENDLPLDSKFSNDEKIIVPPYRSGVLVKFGVTKSKIATLKLYKESGKPLAAGTVVKLFDSDQEYMVGYKGELYLDNLKDNVVSGKAFWAGKSCKFEVKLPEEKIVPNLGKIVCYK